MIAHLFGFLAFHLIISSPSDEIGPHGGFLRKPGSFYTEVILGAKELKVFLLDRDQKNASTKDSEIKVRYLSKTIEHELECRITGQVFRCRLPDSFSSQEGSFFIEAKRENSLRGSAEYQLPLRRPKTVK
jgi:hypothetical protein